MEWEGAAPLPPLIWGAGRLPWPLLQASRAAARGKSRGQVFPPLFWKVLLGFPLGLAGWAFGALCAWPKVARALPLRPTQASDKWGHVGPTPEPSRTFQYNTDKPQNDSGIQKLLSFI